MGNKSPAAAANDVQNDGLERTSTMARAIARGRVYVILRYPIAVEKLEGTLFNEDQFREVLSHLQQVSMQGYHEQPMRNSLIFVGYANYLTATFYCPPWSV